MKLESYLIRYNFLFTNKLSITFIDPITILGPGLVSSGTSPRLPTSGRSGATSARSSNSRTPDTQACHCFFFVIRFLYKEGVSICLSQLHIFLAKLFLTGNSSQLIDTVVLVGLE